MELFNRGAFARRQRGARRVARPVHPPHSPPLGFSMPNFHPHLVAAVSPLLEAGEEVWAVYASPRTSLVATATRLFIVGRDGTLAWPLDELAVLRRTRPSLVVLEWRSGRALPVRVDPRDEHGIQALTVIGLLLAIAAKPSMQPGASPPARSAPAAPPRPTLRHNAIIRLDGQRVPARHWVVARPRALASASAASSARAVKSS